MIKCKVKLFTHSDLDGIGCAILANLAFEDVTIQVCDYSNVDETIQGQLTKLNKYDIVFITDLNLSDQTMICLNAASKQGLNVKLMDHHVQSLNHLDKFWVTARIYDGDNKTCGTEIFYKYLLDSTNLYYSFILSQFVKLVTMYDTWTWPSQGESGVLSKHINELLYLYGKDDFMSHMLKQLRSNKPEIELSAFDKRILKLRQREIDDYIKERESRLQKMKYGHYNCGVVFADRFTSQCGNTICKNNLDIDFVFLISMEYGSVSLRTIKQVDVSKIAANYGGGGHAAAAGFQINEKFMEDVVNNMLTITSESDDALENSIYPLTVVADRYNGVYSGGVFTAWNKYNDELPSAIFGDDTSCMEFWSKNDNILCGRGDTIDSAIADLYGKLPARELRD